MDEPIRVFIGFDRREAAAFNDGQWRADREAMPYAGRVPLRHLRCDAASPAVADAAPLR
ncbi:MAG TPA: hypothetical protein VN667_16375 [Burkholderiales bacterium]|nr:hypothetical protein [Burkholderiales bacterium]